MIKMFYEHHQNYDFNIILICRIQSKAFCISGNEMVNICNFMKYDCFVRADAYIQFILWNLHFSTLVFYMVYVETRSSFIFLKDLGLNYWKNQMGKYSIFFNDKSFDFKFREY